MRSDERRRCAEMTPEGATLLLVDDNEMLRKVLRRLMRTLGISRIDEAPDGVAALELFQKTAYDLVLTDWNMPRMNGLELVERIRHGEVRSDTPVVLFTGEASSRNLLDALKAGATDYIGKPFVAGIVCQKVLRILNLLPRENPTPV